MFSIDTPGGVKISAPAKINLHLDIGDVREDGFHNLVSLFQMVDLSDTLNIYIDPAGTSSGKCVMESNMNIPDEDNLIIRALGLMRQRTGIKRDLMVRCVKRIPMGSGLGGGSSDAAALIKGFYVLFGLKPDRQEMLSLAAELGSDVPFFMGTPTAIVTGRGEHLTPVETVWKKTVVLALPDLHVSTKEAFALLDSERNSGRDTSIPSDAPGAYRFPDGPAETGDEIFRPEAVISSYRNLKPDQWKFFNSFLPVLARRNPVYKAAIDTLSEAGALFSNVSGSGSAVFGVFNSRKEAISGLKTLKKTVCGGVIVKMLDKPTYAVYNTH